MLFLNTRAVLINAIKASMLIIAVPKLDVINADIATIEQIFVTKIGEAHFKRYQREFNTAAITPQAPKIKLIDDLGKKISSRVEVLKSSSLTQASKDTITHNIYNIIYAANDIIKVINTQPKAQQVPTSKAIAQFNANIEQVGTRMENIMQMVHRLNYKLPYNQDIIFYSYYIMCVWQVITQNIYTFIEQHTASKQSEPKKLTGAQTRQAQLRSAQLTSKLDQLAALTARLK